MSSAFIYTNTYLQQIQSISLPYKYTTWYCQIVHRAQLRANTKKLAETAIGVKIEKHHILPKSFKMGGEKDNLNYAFLTLREHFICHWLLTKMVVGKEKAKMFHALGLLNGKHRKSSRVYEYIKNNIGPRSPEHCANLSAAKKGKPSARKGKTNIELYGEEKAAILKERSSNSHKGNIPSNKGKPSNRKGIPNLGVTIALTGRPSKLKGRPSPNKGKKFGPASKESCDKRALSMLGKNIGPQETVTCPYCNKMGGASNMKRYHFENCKLIT